MRITETKLRKIIREHLLLEYVAGRCPGCGVQGEKGKNYCRKCGTKMGVCPHEGCGHPLNESPTQKFCQKCGKRVPMNESEGAKGDSSENPSLQTKEMQSKISSGLSAAERAFNASQKFLGSRNKMTPFFEERTKLWGELLGASKKNDVELFSRLKKQLKAVNEKLIEAAKEDIASYEEWESAMREMGVEIPLSMKKALEDKVEMYRQQKDENESFTDEVENNLRIVIKNNEKDYKEFEQKAQKISSVLDDMGQDNDKFNRKVVVANRKKAEVHEAAIEELEPLIREIQDMLRSSKGDSRPSEEEKQAYEEIIVPYDRKYNEIFDRHKELQDQLLSMVGKKDPKEVLAFQKQEYMPFVKREMYPHFQEMGNTWIKFFKRVKKKGAKVSRDNLRHILLLINNELNHHRDMLDIYERNSTV